MNSYGFIMYVMTERACAIEKNKQLISKLQRELDSDTVYQKVVKGFQSGKKKKQMIEQKLEENYWHYQLDREDEVILEYSNQIQILTEAISEKEQKIRFIQLMMEELEQKKGINYIHLFFEFHRKNKQMISEELEDNISIRKQIFQFISLHHAVLKKQRKYAILGGSSQDSLRHLFTYYTSIQNQLQQEKDRKMMKLQESIQFKRDYPKMQKKLEEDRNTLDTVLQQLQPFVEKMETERSLKQNEIVRLIQENMEYQKAIDYFTEWYVNSESPETKLSSSQYQKQGGKYYGTNTRNNQ